jgi:outer membrane protein insertion porin family
MAPMGRSLLSIFFACFLSGALISPGAGVAQAQAPPGALPIVVMEIGVQGNRRIQEAVILGRVQTAVGDPMIPGRLSQDIRAIFGLGFFDDVQLKVEDFEGGVKVTFVVTERPFVRDIIFAGNRRVDTTALRDKIDLKLGGVYNPVDVNRAVERLRDHYEEEGYFEVQISPDVQPLPDGDVTVLFRIAEGRKITIQEIIVAGAEGLRAKDIKAVMATQERQYLILRGTVQRQRLDQDIDRITQLYNDHGYLQARVESAEIDVDRTRARATIRIRVVEGPQFRVSTIDVVGNTVLPLEEIQRRILLKPGDVFSRSKIGDSIRGIADLYSAVGRASAEVIPTTSQDPAGRRMSLRLEIVEGPEVFIERINITGNTRSQEKILRRELPMAEGDLFTNQKLARARQKLINLGYFEQVRVITLPGSATDRIVVSIEVTERPTGLFSIGGGFSSADSFLGTLDLSQRNFLGRGWEVFLRLRVGSRTQQGTVGFTEPWLFDRPLSFGFDLFNNRREFAEYDVKSLGGDIRLGHPIAEFSRWNAIYRITQDEVTDLPADASQVLRDEEGKRLTSLVGLSLTRDTRDNIFEPTQGSRVSLIVDFAGVGFGDSRFVRTIGTAAYFHPVWWGHVLSGRAEAGYAIGWGGETLPLFERFYLGGASSIRSFKARQVSPRDETGNRIGGNIEVLGNIEYIVPLGAGFRAVLFYDVGNVYGPGIPGGTDFDIADLKQAVGVGLRWASPFGPIRVDYGINLDRKVDERFGVFHFAIGATF